MLILSQYLLSLEGQDFYDGKKFFFTISILLILNNVSIMFDIIVKIVNVPLFSVKSAFCKKFIP